MTLRPVLDSHVLASGSADQRVLLWDLDSQQPASTLSCGGKVQTLAWHPRQVDCLLSGDCAGSVTQRHLRRRRRRSLTLQAWCSMF